MPESPNILFLMADQLQAQVFEPDHVCQTPQLDRLAACGLRFTRAYTPSPVCSPARASLMTGLLPHNHGVLWVTHNDPDHGQLRDDHPHWAQRLTSAGYRTGYFGKWHVEHTEQPSRFGWKTDASLNSSMYRTVDGQPNASDTSLVGPVRRHEDRPRGYLHSLHYGVTGQPPVERPVGQITQLASGWLHEACAAGEPWCAFVSVEEPHDPFIAGTEAFSKYDVDTIPLPPTISDGLAGRPALYRRAARTWAGMSAQEHREAAACYYAAITEVDTMFGTLIDQVGAAGQLENTVVVVTTDHGELLGAHGMYTKNIMAAEQVYNIPLIIAGPGVAEAATTTARVGLHDLAPTLLDLTGAEPIPGTDGVSFAPVVADPASHEGTWCTGYAEFNGGRYLITQRVLWDDDVKFVFNGFDDDELYDLAADPHELTNLIHDDRYADMADAMMTRIWQIIRSTGDQPLLNSQYPPLRLARIGPEEVQT